MSKFTFVNPLKKPEFLLFFVSFIFVSFTALLILIHKTSLPPLIPFWFSRNWGPERLSQPETIWVIPGLGLAFLLLDFTLAQLIYEKRPALSRIFAGSSVLISLILLFAIYKILLVVS